ncbi:MAG: (d)CMP kinase [Bacteroidota bacterium]|nr:(d)CMP kinase [Bacteroidota bacterium]
MRKIIIAIDGFSSCGKSTMAKDLAKKLDYRYVDSGAMYRAVTFYFMSKHLDYTQHSIVLSELPNIHIEFHLNTETKNSDTYLNGENVEEKIRGMNVSMHVSNVSTIKEVRHAMVALQKQMSRSKAIVMDGRDIGTAVFPNAELKIFVTANPETRAQRRYKELQVKGEDVTMEEVKQNLAERDHIDSTRKESPLQQAEDAIVLDNSHLSKEQQMEFVYNLVMEKKLMEDIQLHQLHFSQGERDLV